MKTLKEKQIEKKEDVLRLAWKPFIYTEDVEECIKEILEEIEGVMNRSEEHTSELQSH